ncbi:MAG: type I DNA topoisomerase [Clostridia bacterium]|nr:type I DNA topoisomerase [Clostridia bacterium]
MSKLLIVESPSKAKTITKYLGDDYVVKASMGHLRDLPKKKLAVDPENDFAVDYEPIEGKGKLIKELSDAASAADLIYLATDPDREGEAISWHLAELLKLDPKKTSRVTFNEITKPAITEAVKHPRDIDMDLVNAQQARRILDRIVGYKLSPFLWKKVRKGLSAGRVQSVVTRLIVDREREINAFIPDEYWTIDALLSYEGKDFIAHFYGNQKGKLELKSHEDVDKVLTAIDGAKYIVASYKTSKKKRQPAPPFITSTLQQDASRRLSMPAKRVMKVAQELYEGVEGLGGLITYIRTDSLRIAESALSDVRSFIGERFGSEYKPAKARYFKTKKDAQDAHEAIRPTNPALEPDKIKKSLTPDQYKLYKLIWSRFVASQMSDAILDTAAADIDANGYIFRATGTSVAFPGFLALYEESRDEQSEAEAPLPVLKEDDTTEFKGLEEKQHFTQPPARYTEASLIKAMEEKGIGRPSTYAPTISVILDREYVIKEGKTLRPSALGEAVTDLMAERFADIVDVSFTASMEDKLDDVEQGETDYKAVLRDFYGDFMDELTAAEKAMEKQYVKVRDEESDVVCDLCGRKMVIKVGRFGKFLACPGYPECKNTKPLSQDTNVACPVCGSKLLKKKSKSGYYYYGCEKNPTCGFMTWDSPTNKKCPKCGGVLFRHYTKEDKRILCHVPNCGYEEPIATRKKAEEGEEAKKPAKKTAAKKTTKKTTKKA